MSVIKAKKIQKSYGSLNVLSDVSFSLGQGQKVALVGHNGTGKTTLLKILAGVEDFDSGELEIQKDVCVGYLPQDTSLLTDEKILVYLKRSAGIDVLEEQIDYLSDKLEDPVCAKRYEEVREKYERLGGYSFVHRTEVMLVGFGLEKVQLQDGVTTLSSGQKSKLVLIGILLKGVDLLLLDEPTNNLDLPALIWLEDFLKKTDATYIVVSHDRRFLDRIVKKIFELDWNTHTLCITNGTYSDYIVMMQKRLSKQKDEYHLQQEEIERLSERAKEKRLASEKGSRWVGTDNDKFLRGFKRNKAGGSARVAKTIEKRIEMMDKIEKPLEREPLEINIRPENGVGTLSVRLIDVITGYPDGFTIGPISLEMQYKDRVGIMGLNGSGKSTLLKTVTGRLKPLSGEIHVGSGIKIGNMMQEHETLPKEETLLNFLMQSSGLDQSESYAKLTKFAFDERQIKLPIKTLSPGGRARLLLALFSAQSINLLILDEPTNHLDIEALEALEETLQTYQGTVLLVSHDRYFLEKAGLNTTYLLHDGKFSRIPDYKEYVASTEEKAKKLLKLLYK